MRYDWLWLWGDGPAEGLRGGTAYKTEGAALRAGQQYRRQLIEADRRLKKEYPDKENFAFVRPLGTLKVVPYNEPGPVVYWAG